MKNKDLVKTIILVLLLILVQNIFGQNKIYLDKNWKKTTQENASFYRVLEKEEGGIYHVKDYYINGNMQMDGYFSNLEKETLHGKIVWFNKKGEKTNLKNYKKGILEGETITYLNNGEILSKGIYKNDKPYDGLILDGCACPVSFYNYEKGNKKSEIILYKDTHQKAEEKFFIIQKDIENDYYNEELPLKKVFYNKKNKEIGVLYYNSQKYAKISHGVEYLFYKENEEVTTIKTKTTYNNEGKKEKVTHYYKNRKIWLQGEYKNATEWNGSFLIDRTQKTFKEGIQVGEEITYDNSFEKELARVTYKNEKPYNGSVIRYRTIKTYKDGAIVKEKEYYSYDFDKVKKQIVFSGKKSQIDWYNKEGELIGTGYINEDIKEGFFIDGYEQIHYQNNKKNGIGKTFKYDDTLESVIQYKNDTIIWKETPKIKTKNEFLHCIYKDNKPYSGQERKYQRVVYYKNGFVSREDKYDKNYDTEELLLEQEIFHDLNKEYYNVNKKIVYRNNKKYTIIYKDGKPYEGVDWSYDGEYFTYKNGKKNGLYRLFSSAKLVEEGNYVDGLKEGDIQFLPIKKEKSICKFLKGEPLNGIVSTYNSKTSYKDGKKHGETIKYYSDVTIIENYNNGTKEGEQKNIFPNGEIIKGIYKEGKEFTGSFYNFRTGATSTYLKGEKHGTFTTINEIVLQKVVYKSGLPISEKSIIKQKDSLIGNGKYKKGKAFTGRFLTKGSGNRNYIISNYKKGKKEGEEIEINIQEIRSDIIKKYNYKKGRKHGKYFNRNKEELPSFTKKINGIYKNGKAYSGQFSKDNKKGLKVLSTYKKGEKEGFEYYETSHGVKDSLLYKKGNIIEGTQLEILKGSSGGYYYRHIYKNGKKEKIINNHNSVTISYNTTGFTIKGELKAEVIFTNKEKTIGMIFYYKNKELLGFLHFEKGKLISGKFEMDFLLKRDFIKTKIKIEEKQVVTTLFPKKEVGLYYKVYSSIDIPMHLSYKNHREIMAVFSYTGKKDMLVKQYLNDGTQLTTFHFSDKNAYGMLVDHKEKEEGKITFSIRYVKKGQEQKDAIKINNLNYEELLEEVKKIKEKEQI